MANFCRKCGSPLVNGRCPNCDMPVYVNNQGDIIGDAMNSVRRLFGQGDISGIVVFVGFVFLALANLLYGIVQFKQLLYYDESAGGISYCTMIFGFLGAVCIGSYVIRAFQGRKLFGNAFILSAVSLLYAFQALHDLIVYIYRSRAGYYGYYGWLPFGCITVGLTLLFVLHAYLYFKKSNGIWSTASLVCVIALALMRILNIFSTPVIFLIIYIFMFLVVIFTACVYAKDLTKDQN